MASKEHDLVDTGITFASGAAYGMTTVAVGQPFDTIKTVVQSSGEGTVAATRRVVAESGLLKGLWRGSLPLVLGGTCAGRVLFLLPRRHAVAETRHSFSLPMPAQVHAERPIRLQRSGERRAAGLVDPVIQDRRRREPHRAGGHVRRVR